jgi:hypothetical protein
VWECTFPPVECLAVGHDKHAIFCPTLRILDVLALRIDLLIVMRDEIYDLRVDFAVRRILGNIWLVVSL